MHVVLYECPIRQAKGSMMNDVTIDPQTMIAEIEDRFKVLTVGIVAIFRDGTVDGGILYVPIKRGQSWESIVKRTVESGKIHVGNIEPVHQLLPQLLKILEPATD